MKSKQVGIQIGPWTLEEVHGIWWGYLSKEPRPKDRQFITHMRQPKPVILGPYHSLAFAKEKAAKEPVP